MAYFVPCRHTLGDVLAGYFCPVNYGRPNPKAQLLARLRHACLAGACPPPLVISGYGFWDYVDFALLRCEHQCLGPGYGDNGWTRDTVQGRRNLLYAAGQLSEFPAEPAVQLPQRAPEVSPPGQYILFTDGAGSKDRGLSDRRIIDWLQRYLPVVRIGSRQGAWTLPMGARGATPAMLDLSDRTELTQVFWLARRARLIVSPCSYLRTMSALVGTPVLELLQADSAAEATVRRTIKEYCGLEYGMQPGERNLWCLWGGAPSAEAMAQIERLLASAPTPGWHEGSTRSRAALG